MANLINVHGRWINQEKPGGAVFFVGGGTVAFNGKGASDGSGRVGITPEQPFATIDGTRGAHASCVASRGDTIVLLPGSITITSAIALDLADVTLTGTKGSTAVHPSSIVSSLASSADAINVTGANIVIEDLNFAASTAATTSRIDVAAANCTIRNNSFNCGANDLETITIQGAGDELTIEGNRFYVTADGPDAAIEIESAGVNRLEVKNNVFNGGTDTNAWDVGSINSAVAHTNCLIEGNRSFESVAGIKFSAAATGIIANNILGGGTLGSMLDPGSCMCAENYEADAINQSARLFPDTVAS
jgi:hypothetical protein